MTGSSWSCRWREKILLRNEGAIRDPFAWNSLQIEFLD
jgi:hypothetical protein